ncbi:MAG TPA: hypothetical protein PKH23_03600, partial [Bacillota bacterium]|nr:hypothetical protein [Bacillota bacterium]
MLKNRSVPFLNGNRNSISRLFPGSGVDVLSKTDGVVKGAVRALDTPVYVTPTVRFAVECRVC